MRGGMMLRVDDQEAPVTQAELADFEKELNASLPKAYREFLLRSNGGLPTPDVVEIEGAPGSPTDVQVLFGIDRSVESSDLRWNKATFSDRIPARMLPVACDSGGNLFCLSLSEEDSGSVFYINLESQEPRLFVVAKDFDGFLDKIRE
jgi:hypothetical protein